MNSHSIAALLIATVPLFRPSPATPPKTPPAPTLRLAKPGTPLSPEQRKSLAAEIVAQTHALPPPAQPHLPSPFTLSTATLSATNAAILELTLRYPIYLAGVNGVPAEVDFPGVPHPIAPQISVAWASVPNAIYMVDCTVGDRAGGAAFTEVDWGGGSISPVPYANATHLVFALTATQSDPARWGSTLGFTAIAGFHLSADKNWSWHGCEVTLVGVLP